MGQPGGRNVIIGGGLFTALVAFMMVTFILTLAGGIGLSVLDYLKQVEAASTGTIVESGLLENATENCWRICIGSFGTLVGLFTGKLSS